MTKLRQTHRHRFRKHAKHNSDNDTPTTPKPPMNTTTDMTTITDSTNSSETITATTAVNSSGGVDWSQSVGGGDSSGGGDATLLPAPLFDESWTEGTSSESTSTWDIGTNTPRAHHSSDTRREESAVHNKPPDMSPIVTKENERWDDLLSYYDRLQILRDGITDNRKYKNSIE